MTLNSMAVACLNIIEHNAALKKLTLNSDALQFHSAFCELAT